MRTLKKLERTQAAQLLLPLLAVLILALNISSALALLCGVTFSLLFQNPYSKKTKTLVPLLLQFSIIGLGAGMNLNTVLRAGSSGFLYTITGIALTLFIGCAILPRLMRWKENSDTAFLITAGTAICGGSAIAAVSGAIRAKERDMSVALGTVFILNSAALLIFPPIGHFIGLTQTQFGLWSALAIHDTSSVVGAALQYGSNALEVATTVKLARALWIVPLTLLVAFGFLYKKKNTEGKTVIKKPWFILGFLAAAALCTWVPALQAPGHLVYGLAKKALVLTIFLIGTNLSLSSIKEVGPRPLLHGVFLWIIVSTATLGCILAGWIHG